MSENKSSDLGFFGRLAKSIVVAVSRLPLGVMYFFSDIACFVMYRIVRYRLSTVRQNLRIAFPNESDDALRSIEKRFYKHLADYFFETIKGLTISEEELKSRFVIRNPEVVNDITSQGKSVFLYGAHVGNWEWFTCLPIYFPTVQVQAFYKKQRNAFANDMTVSQRSRRNIHPVESKKGYQHMYRTIKSGLVSLTLILGDQSPRRDAQKFWVDFMGRKTAFLVGPERIASRLDIALVYPSYVGYSRGHYEVEMKVVEVNPASLADGVSVERFAALLEDDLRRIPELWLWSHRRWKLDYKDFQDVSDK